MAVKIVIVNKAQSDAEIQRRFDMLMQESKHICKIHIVGLCYDLISGSFPMPKGSINQGGTLAAFHAGFGNFQKSVDTAFKPIQAVKFGVLAMNRDYESMRAYGYQFNNSRYQYWLDNGKWDYIRGLFERAGYAEDSTLKVIDDANIRLLHDWRRWGTGNPYYVRNRQSIDKLRTANNQVKVGFMAGGWLKAAKQLGMECDKHTVDRRGITWMKWGFGIGYATNNTSRSIKVVAENDYANYGGWMESPQIKQHLNDRYKKIDKDVEIMLKNWGIAT